MNKIELKIQKRKAKIPTRLAYDLVVKTIVNKIVGPKYNAHYQIIDDINKEEGPCFLFYDHQSRLDYIWVSQMCYPRRINFVVGYNEFHRSKFHIMFNILHTIPKKNFAPDVHAIKSINEIIKQGGVVCMSPEGMSSINGHNQQLGLGTGKLIKHHAIPLYIVKSEGAFLTNHKVCLDDRKGRVDARIYKLLTPEQINSLTVEQIEDKINEAIWQDDYEWNKTANVKYDTHHGAAKHLDDLIYKCPKCMKEFTIKAHDDIIECTNCGNGAQIDDYYRFHPLIKDYVLPSTPAKWTDWQREIVKKEIRENPNYVFEEEVKLGVLPEKYLKHNLTSLICGKGKITFDHEGFHYRGTRFGKQFDFDMNYNEIHTLTIVTDCTFFSTYKDKEYLEFYPAKPSVGKALIVCEEMHRLHINTWKQLKNLEHFEDKDGNLKPIE